MHLGLHMASTADPFVASAKPTCRFSRHLPLPALDRNPARWGLRQVISARYFRPAASGGTDQNGELPAFDDERTILDGGGDRGLLAKFLGHVPKLYFPIPGSRWEMMSLIAAPPYQ